MFLNYAHEIIKSRFSKNELCQFRVYCVLVMKLPTQFLLVFVNLLFKSPFLVGKNFQYDFSRFMKPVSNQILCIF